jgi:hypothetical protein
MRLSDLSGYPSCRVQVNLKNHKLSFLEGDFWGIETTSTCNATIRPK